MPRVLYGAGGHGKVIWEAALQSGRPIDYFVDDNPRTTSVCGIPVITSEKLRELGPVEWLVAIGANQGRASVYERLLKCGEPMLIRHPASVIASRSAIELGTVVMAGVVVQTDAVIGRNVILNTSCSVDHDCIIGDHVHICPGVRLAGTVKVGAGTMLGTGASVIPGITIGANCLIAAGSVVVRDVPGNSLVMGNPARVIRTQAPVVEFGS